MLCIFVCVHHNASRWNDFAAAEEGNVALFRYGRRCYIQCEWCFCGAHQAKTRDRHRSKAKQSRLSFLLKEMDFVIASSRSFLIVSLFAATAQLDGEGSNELKRLTCEDDPSIRQLSLIALASFLLPPKRQNPSK